MVLLVYSEGLVEDLRTSFEDQLDFAFESTWDLVRILLWIFIAWLFVDGALTVALSFSEHRHTLHDVMKRLDAIEAKLGEADDGRFDEAAEPVAGRGTDERGEEPPPPRE